MTFVNSGGINASGGGSKCLGDFVAAADFHRSVLRSSGWGPVVCICRAQAEMILVKICLSPPPSIISHPLAPPAPRRYFDDRSASGCGSTTGTPPRRRSQSELTRLREEHDDRLEILHREVKEKVRKPGQTCYRQYRCFYEEPTDKNKSGRFCHKDYCLSPGPVVTLGTI